MRIGIDGFALTLPYPCGTKSYANELLKNLAKIDKHNDYVIFASKQINIPNQKNFKFVKFPNFLPIFKRQTLLPFLVKKEKIDIFHNLELFGSVFLNFPKIVTTVHDVNLDLTYPLLSKYFLKRLLSELIKNVVINKSDTLITDSETIKKELSKTCNEDMQNKIHCINLSHEIVFKPNNLVKTKKNILCMGDFAKRKNIFMLLKAYVLLNESFKRFHALNIVVSNEKDRKKFCKMVNNLNIERYVKIFVNVSKSKLVSLYNSSFVFIYPSLYEGFGIPILEAMSCGCPVITSNYGTMKEIANDSAVFINPNSPISIKNGILRFFNDSKLREKMINKGLLNAKKFSWIKTAKKTLKIYKNLYEKI